MCLIKVITKRREDKITSLSEFLVIRVFTSGMVLEVCGVGYTEIKLW